MTQYLLSVHSIDGEPTPALDVMERMYQDVDDLNAELRAAGAWVFAGGLQPASTATVVRARDGRVGTADGPFAQTKVQLGGFWVVETKDLDEVLGWAAKATVACAAPVGVRPFQEMPAG